MQVCAAWDAVVEAQQEVRSSGLAAADDLQAAAGQLEPLLLCQLQDEDGRRQDGNAVDLVQTAGALQRVHDALTLAADGLKQEVSVRSFSGACNSIESALAEFEAALQGTTSCVPDTPPPHPSTAPEVVQRVAERCQRCGLRGPPG